MNFVRTLSLILLLLSPAAAWSDVLPVTVNTTFHNENWFPLTEKDMKEAAIDTAMAQISATGLLAFVPPGNGSGRLAMRVTLVEPAKLVKLTLELDAAGRPSAVATASTSIDGLDHDGIYYAFEHVGREAAERLNAKLVSVNTVTVNVPNRSAPAQPAPGPLPPRACDDAVLRQLTAGDRRQWQAKAIYLRGQQLKEMFCYFDARVAFESVAADERQENAAWRQLAQNELGYGLPLFEARQLQLRLSLLIKDESKGWADISAYLRHIEQLYRQVLVENESSVERVMSTQSELDNFHVSWEALKNSVGFNTDGQVDHLNRFMRRDLAMHDGRLPLDTDEFKRRLAAALLQFEVLDYSASRRTGEGKVRVRHKRWGTEWELVYDGGLDVQSKRLH